MPHNIIKKHPMIAVLGGIFAASMAMTDSGANSTPPVTVSPSVAACDVKLKGNNVFSAVVYDTASNVELYRFVQNARTMETPLAGSAKVRYYKTSTVAGEFIVNAEGGKPVSCEILDNSDNLNNTYEVHPRDQLAQANPKVS